MENITKNIKRFHALIHAHMKSQAEDAEMLEIWDKHLSEATQTAASDLSTGIQRFDKIIRSYRDQASDKEMVDLWDEIGLELDGFPFTKIFTETLDALKTAWSCLIKICPRSALGCKKCPLRCPQDEFDSHVSPLEHERITDETDPNYWKGCPYSKIPDTVRRADSYRDIDNL